MIMVKVQTENTLLKAEVRSAWSLAGFIFCDCDGSRLRGVASRGLLGRRMWRHPHLQKEAASCLLSVPPPSSCLLVRSFPPRPQATSSTCAVLQVEQIKASRADMERQFHSLYYDKYVPMKAELLPLRQDSGALRAQLAAEEAKVGFSSRVAGEWEGLCSAGEGRRPQTCRLEGQGGNRLPACVAESERGQMLGLSRHVEGKERTVNIAKFT